MIEVYRAIAICSLAVVVGCASTPRGLSAAGRQQTSNSVTCDQDAEWNDPAPPMHIYGDTWYVGSCALSAILITTPTGHVLIDGDTQQAPAMIEARVRLLGFQVRDIRFIAISHAHVDHVGGVEQLRQDSGATVVARGADADALTRGKGDRSDPQFMSIGGFPGVAHVRQVTDGETLTIGAFTITAHATPGHTPGSTSWTWESCEQSRCLHMVYADSLSAISDDTYQFTDERANPGVLSKFRASIALVGSLLCDILLTPHPGVSQMWQRIGPQTSAPLIDAAACKRYSDSAVDGLNMRIEKELGSQ